MKELKADVATYKADGDESFHHAGIRIRKQESAAQLSGILTKHPFIKVV